MSQARWTVSALFVFSAGSWPALAHHSIAAQFDGNKPVRPIGVVTKIEWRKAPSRCRRTDKSALGKLEAHPEKALAGVEPAGFNEFFIVGGHAAKVARLPPIHKHPSDRLLVGQARFEPMILFTIYELLRGYGDFVELV